MYLEHLEPRRLVLGAHQLAAPEADFLHALQGRKEGALACGK
jgi:hypothetical protein